MKSDILIEGRGLDELYQFLEDKGLELDVKYRFNHWFLSAEIAGVRLSGDREEILSVLLDYYADRKGKDVTLTIDENECISFRNKEIAAIRKEMSQVMAVTSQKILTPC